MCELHLQGPKHTLGCHPHVLTPNMLGKKKKKKRTQRSAIVEAETSKEWTRLNWESETNGLCQLAWDYHFTFIQVGTQSRHLTVGYRRRRQIQHGYIYDLNQLQVRTCFLPVMGLYFPKTSQSFLILKEKDQTAEYFKAIKKRSEPFI